MGDIGIIEVSSPYVRVVHVPWRAGMAIGPTHSSAGCFDNIVSVAGEHVNFVIKIVVRFLSLPVF